MSTAVRLMLLYPPLEGEGRSRPRSEASSARERGGVEMMKRRISDFKRSAAKRLRTNTTEAEAILWRSLRHLEINRTHFRRQVPIGRYIVDFACLTHRLIIEVDGSQHGETGNVEHDLKRTRWLEGEGYRVLRFWNNDVIARTGAVVEAIHDAISITPPRPLERCSASSGAGDPPPQGEGRGQ